MSEVVDDKLFASKAVEWFLGFIPEDQWVERRDSIVSYLKYINTPRGLLGFNRIVFDDDKFGWYLVLVDLYIKGETYFDMFQLSRVISYFVSVGKYLCYLNLVRGVEDRVKKLILKSNDNPDSGLFEILTAALYVRSGYRKVEFIKECSYKTPDLIVENDNFTYYVECKRMSKISDYSYREREKWMKMSMLLLDYVRSRNINVFVKIFFDKELFDCNDSCLIKAMKDALGSRDNIGKSENGEVTVWYEGVDVEKIRNHFLRYSVKSNSPFLIKLITGEYRPYGNYRLSFEPELSEEKPGYLEGVYNPSALSWKSRSEVALEKKSRHVRKLLSDAVKQLPKGEKGVVHFGIEAVEGDEIEQIRLIKNMMQLSSFDAGDVNLDWVYIHLLAPGSSPEENWFFEETSVSFSSKDFSIPRLERSNLTPFTTVNNGFAWEFRDPV